MNGNPRLLLAGLFSLLAAEAAALQQTDGLYRHNPSASGLSEEIRNATALELYAVELTFERPVTIGELRAVAAQLRLPRVLAYLEYGVLPDGRPGGMSILGLGEMYADDPARQHSECRALTSVKSGPPNELRDVPIDDWTTTRIHVHAVAHDIRELMSGLSLPAATPTDGGRAEPQHLRGLESYTRGEITQPISPQRSVELPEYCAQFLAPLDAPTVAGGFPAGFRYPEVLDGEDVRAYAYRILAELPPDSAVTIQLKLNVQANVEALSALVRQFDIKGMSAALVPLYSDERIIARAELSTFGAKPADQIRRVRCQIGLAGDGPQATSEWYADWISVSLSRENAAQLLSHPNLAFVRVSGSFPMTELGRLEGYFEGLVDKVYEMPRSIRIPSGCEDVYIHNDQEDAGSSEFIRAPESRQQ